MVVETAFFEKIEHASVVDAVVNQIEGLIVAGVLKEGTRLPPERDMAQIMDVSRQKLREALKQLENYGLIRVRHGEGTFVAPLTGTALSPAMLDLYSRHESAFMDYLEYRREQEGFAASLAAERATTVDRELLSSIMEQMKEAHGKGNLKLEQELDMRFHTGIVDASHNSTLIHMMGSIYELTRRGVFFNRDFLWSMPGTGQSLLEQHIEIGQSILDGDSEKARDAAHAHIDFVAKLSALGKTQEERERIAKKRTALLIEKLEGQDG
ncbi:FadR/GntR family transcriptional regulator [Kiloniella sp. b19]|uniref:FadR/GntR family transcriptional regulator n=1 Tax=Kiloniella sp. GXU_MW_B19 TaxID=3141326 RepID=UPI0031E35349